MASVRLDSVGKTYPNGFQAIEKIDLTINDGEFLVLVGPSGCGKSTLLRLLAGLETVSRGEVRIAEQPVNMLEPAQRDIAMVFQNYALYPHMTVYNNMAYGLKNRKMDKATIEQRVNDAAAMLEIEALLDRKPKQLSGGQRQRVAMGRAIVRQPQVFLFDEPLSNLDAKLRVQMRMEIKRVQRELGTTTVYVTHDQTEAMTMADRLVVMNNGVAEQVGTPLELYSEPETVFVAGFIGSPAMNFLRVAETNEKSIVLSDGASLPVSNKLETDAANLLLGVRPEDLTMSSEGTLTAQVELIEPLGSETLIHCKLRQSGEVLTVRHTGSTDVVFGDTVHFDIAAGKQHFFNADTGLRIS